MQMHKVILLAGTVIENVTTTLTPQHKASNSSLLSVNYLTYSCPSRSLSLEVQYSSKSVVVTQRHPYFSGSAKVQKETLTSLLEPTTAAKRFVGLEPPTLQNLTEWASSRSYCSMDLIHCANCPERMCK
jgi:hypothetical protein